MVRTRVLGWPRVYEPTVTPFLRRERSHARAADVLSTARRRAQASTDYQRFSDLLDDAEYAFDVYSEEELRQKYMSSDQGDSEASSQALIRDDDDLKRVADMMTQGAPTRRPLNYVTTMIHGLFLPATR